MKNFNDKQKIILLTLALLTVAILPFVLTSCSRDLPSQCIRIHIRANSNSESDQAVKYAVRDNLTAYLTDLLEGCKTKNEAKSRIKSHSAEIKNIADATLSQNGFSYVSTLKIGVEHFPERTYDSYDFPEGDYEAVILNLGSGEGENWWCVAFPPLCFVPNGESGEKVVYKSWIKEMLDNLFSK